jgi:hypothetical protein
MQLQATCNMHHHIALATDCNNQDDTFPAALLDVPMIVYNSGSDDLRVRPLCRRR